MTGFVKSMSDEERKLCLKRIFEWLHDEGANKKLEVPMKSKNPIGRPRKSNPQMTIATMATSIPLLEQS